MRIGTAEPVSTFLSQGQALAGMLERHGIAGPIEVLVSPGASIDNANRLHNGEIELGFMAANWIGRAKRGEAPFKQPIDLRMVAPMNAGPLYFIACKSSGLNSFDDLAGKRVCVGPLNSGMTQHAHTMLGALGRTIDWFQPVYLSFKDGAEALANGEVDAQLQCPIPNTVMTALDERVPLRVLRYGTNQLETILAKVPFYRRVQMSKGALRALDADVDQPGVLNVLVCHARSRADDISTVTAAIVAGAGELERANGLFRGLPSLFEPLKAEGAKALEFGGVVLHGGALDAYRKAGLIGRA
jgi:TRAP transporter TAXI family solute receptor